MYICIYIQRGALADELLLGTVNRSTGHTHAHTDREQHPRHRHTHTHTTRTTPQTNTFHKHLTTLEGAATTVRATSHARVSGHDEVWN